MSNANFDPDESLKESGRQSSEWAAYVIGRHSSLIAVWRSMTTDTGLAPQDLTEPPWKEMRYEGESAPDRLFDVLNVALRLIAVRGQTNVAVLVELHRVFDEMRSSCSQFETEDLSDSSTEDYWQDKSSEIEEAEQLASELLNHDHFALPWFRLGQAIGTTLLELYNPTFSPLTWLSTLTELATVLASPQRDEMNAFIEDATTELGGLPGMLPPDTNDLFSELASLDHDILSWLTEGEQTVVLEVDHTRRGLRFFGHSISFDSFDGQAAGGLKVLLALADCPGQFLTLEELDAATSASISDSTLSQYLSAFRSLVKLLIDRADRERLIQPAFKDKAPLAFIIAQRGQRSSNRPLRYRLALAPSQVQVIGRPNE